MIAERQKSRGEKEDFHAGGSDCRKPKMKISKRKRKLRLEARRFVDLSLAAALLCGATVASAQIVIHTAADLQGVSSNMQASYVLDSDIDVSSITNFSPIGLSANAAPVPFTGILDGAGHTIIGFTQASTGQYAGLFAQIGSGGSVKNLRLQNALITSNYGGGSAASGNPIPGMIGILAGENDQGTIDTVTVNGAVVTTSSGSACGVIVGVNLGTISNSIAYPTLTATLSDSDTGLLDQSTQIGGIAGRNNGAITNVGAIGTISVQLNAAVSARAVFGAQIGGLVGLSDSAGRLTGSSAGVDISASFSGSAYATAADNPYTAYWNAIGGLVGNAPGTSTIANSFSSGSITVTDDVRPLGGQPIDTVGGLLGSGGTIGANASNGLAQTGVIGNVNPAESPTISDSSAGGTIKATDLRYAPHGASLSVGGLVGVFSGTIASSYASGSVDVEGQGYNGVGGLVGQIGSGTLTDVNTSTSVISVNIGIGNDVGGLAGTSGAAVANAIASGAITSNVTITVPGNGFTSVDSTVGGLVGFNFGVIKSALALGPVTATFAGSVAGSGSSYNNQVAGLVANSAGLISKSSAWGDVSLTSTIITSNGGTATQVAGGLVGGGYIWLGHISTVTDSLSMSAVSASGIDDLFVGSLMGYSNGSIASSYALGKPSVQGGSSGNTIGGLVGRNDIQGSITSSYWDVNQTGLATGVGSGTAKGATNWAGAPATIPAGFDPAVWALETTVNNGYPCLLWQPVCGSKGSLSDSDRIFDFFEAMWPQLFGLTSATSATALGYDYRHYATGFYLATGSGEVYLDRPFLEQVFPNFVVDLGTVAFWLANAEAAGF